MRLRTNMVRVLFLAAAVTAVAGCSSQLEEPGPEPESEIEAEREPGEPPSTSDVDDEAGDAKADEPESCVEGESRVVDCPDGLYQRQKCTYGSWVETQCVECDEGESEIMACDDGSDSTRSCVDGVWSEWSECPSIQAPSCRFDEICCEPAIGGNGCFICAGPGEQCP